MFCSLQLPDLVFCSRLGDPFWIPEDFMPLILSDRFCFGHISLICMVKKKLLAKFSVDHLSCPVRFILIFFWTNMVSTQFTIDAFSCILYILAFIDLVLTELFLATVKWFCFSKDFSTCQFAIPLTFLHVNLLFLWFLFWSVHRIVVIFVFPGF